MTPREGRVSLADMTQVKITEPVTCASDVLRLADQVSKLAYAQTCNLRDLLAEGKTIHVEIGVIG